MGFDRGRGGGGGFDRGRSPHRGGGDRGGFGRGRGGGGGGTRGFSPRGRGGFSPRGGDGFSPRGRGGFSPRGGGGGFRDKSGDFRGGRGHSQDGRGGGRGRGGFRGGDRGGFRGGFRGGDRGGFRGGDRGGFRGGRGGSFRGGRGGFERNEDRFPHKRKFEDDDEGEDQEMEIVTQQPKQNLPDKKKARFSADPPKGGVFAQNKGGKANEKPGKKKLADKFVPKPPSDDDEDEDDDDEMESFEDEEDSDEEMPAKGGVAQDSDDNDDEEEEDDDEEDDDESDEDEEIDEIPAKTPVKVAGTAKPVGKAVRHVDLSAVASPAAVNKAKTPSTPLPQGKAAAESDDEDLDDEEDDEFDDEEDEESDEEDEVVVPKNAKAVAQLAKAKADAAKSKTATSLAAAKKPVPEEEESDEDEEDEDEEDEDEEEEEDESDDQVPVPKQANSAKEKPSALKEKNLNDLKTAKPKEVTKPTPATNTSIKLDQNSIIAEEQRRRDATDRRSIFAKGLPNKVKFTELEKLHPKIRSVRPRNHCAWLVFDSEQDTEKAMKELSGKATIRGHSLEFDFCGSKSKNQASPKKEIGDRKINPLELVAANLPFTTTKEQLKQVFRASVQIVLPKVVNGRPLNAFIKFGSEADAAAAFKKAGNLKIGKDSVDVYYGRLKLEDGGAASPDQKKAEVAQKQREAIAAKVNGDAKGKAAVATTKKAAVNNKEESDDEEDDDDEEDEIGSSGEDIEEEEDEDELDDEEDED